LPDKEDPVRKALSGFSLHTLGDELRQGDTIAVKGKELGRYAVGPATVIIANDGGVGKYVVVEPPLTEREKERLSRVLDHLFMSISHEDAEDPSKRLIPNMVEAARSLGFLDEVTRSLGKYEYYVKRELVGYGRLDVLMKDSNIEDIKCTGHGKPVVVLHKNHSEMRWIRTNIVFPTEEDAEEITQKMLQSEFEDLSDIFGVEGLQRIANLRLPDQEIVELGMHLQELNLYALQHAQVETEVAKMAESDGDCCILMSHPGIAPFTALAMKARIGDVSRFPTKGHLSSYAGLVPEADNTGEHASQHRHVKHGDDVLKYAFTCAVKGAVKAKARTAVKHLYLKQIGKGKAPQKAEVAAARKLSWIVWAMLTSKQRYVEEDRYLTARKLTHIIVSLIRNFKLLTAHFRVGSEFRDNNLTENVNGNIGMKLYLIRGFKNEESARNTLKLMVMHYRFNPFSSCKKKENNGKSPLNLAGVDTSRLDWVTYSQRDSRIMNRL
jgi:hypothetical protein